MISIKEVLLKSISKVLSCAIPRGKVLLFFSYPNYTDNAFAIYKYIRCDSRFRTFSYVWIIDYNYPNALIVEKQIKKDYANTVVLRRNSIRSFWYYYRSKYFFFTHSLYSSFPIIHKDKRINLWHGMPLKKIGLLQENAQSVKTASDVIIASSDLFQGIMAQAFGHPLEKVIVTGMPRNDMFLEKTDFFEKEGIDSKVFKKIGIWLPTYKVSVGDNGDFVKDGVFVEGVAFLDKEGLIKFNAFLSENKYFIIIKLHPMDVLNTLDLPSYSNIRIYKSSEFNYQLYPVLGKVDFLLTDYSSVWVDYEIMNKPIGFVIDDLKEYETNRGFTIDNLISKLPGTLIEDYSSLCSFIDSKMQITKRDSLWNCYKDFNSSQRLINYLENGSI